MQSATEIIKRLKLVNIYEKYNLLRDIPIGSGSYGSVYKFFDIENRKEVAIKIVYYARFDTIERKRLYREIKLLKVLKGNATNHIVGLQNVVTSEEDEHLLGLALVFDYHEACLHRIIVNKKQPLSSAHWQYFIYQILVAVDYMHSANIIHRDLKPSNILVNSNCDAVVCDLGLARSLEPLPTDVEPSSIRAPVPLLGKLTEYVVTRWYRAPEIILGLDNYGLASDMWSVGCILAELILREALFKANNNRELFRLIFSTLGTPNAESCDWIIHKRRFDNLKPEGQYPGTIDEKFSEIDSTAVDLVKKLLCFDPRKRLTAEQALQHPFVVGLYESSCKFSMSSLNNIEQTFLEIYYNFEKLTANCRKSEATNKFIEDHIKGEVKGDAHPNLQSVFTFESPNRVPGTLYHKQPSSNSFASAASSSEPNHDNRAAKRLLG